MCDQIKATESQRPTPEVECVIILMKKVKGVNCEDDVHFSLRRQRLNYNNDEYFIEIYYESFL